MGAVRRIWIGSIAPRPSPRRPSSLIARGGPASSGAAPPRRVDASLDHDAVEFGDPVTATVTVVRTPRRRGDRRARRTSRR